MNSMSPDYTFEHIHVPKNTGVRFYTSIDPGSYVPSHWHPAIEIIYMLEGTLTVTVECVSRVLRAGQCTLINPGVIHATKCTAPNTAILFQIPLDFISLYIPGCISGSRLFLPFFQKTYGKHFSGIPKRAAARDMAVKTAENTALPAIVKSPAFACVRNMSRNDDVINPEPMYTHNITSCGLCRTTRCGK